MMPDTRSVLVTGGAGFIGSHLADAFLEAGSRVTILDDLSTGVLERVPARARFVEGDLRTFDFESLLRAEKVDTILHHAAQIDVRKSVEDPVFDAEVNVIGTIRLARAALACRRHADRLRLERRRHLRRPRGLRRRRKARRRTPSPRTASRSSPARSTSSASRTARPSSSRRSATRTSTARARTGAARRASSGSGWRASSKARPCVIYGDGLNSRDFVYVGDVVAANRAAAARRLRRRLQRRNRRRDDRERALGRGRARLRIDREGRARGRQAGRAAAQRPRRREGPRCARPRRARQPFGGAPPDGGVVPGAAEALSRCAPEPFGPRLITTTVTSSSGAAPPRHDFTAFAMRWAISRAGRRRASDDEALEARRAELAALGVVRLDDAVRVEDDDVARLDVRRAPAVDGVRHRAEHHARRRASPRSRRARRGGAGATGDPRSRRRRRRWSRTRRRRARRTSS